jgi:hypothetical protein
MNTPSLKMYVRINPNCKRFLSKEKIKNKKGYREWPTPQRISEDRARNFYRPIETPNDLMTYGLLCMLLYLYVSKATFEWFTITDWHLQLVYYGPYCSFFFASFYCHVDVAAKKKGNMKTCLTAHALLYFRRRRLRWIDTNPFSF